MSEPFLSEIKLVSFNFAPKGWALCNGQFMPINQNQALFALLGTTYGGNGQTTFALPNLQGKLPIHMGGGHTLGETAGSTSVTINQQSMPAHNHTLSAHNATPGILNGNVGASTKSFAQGLAIVVGGNQPVNIYGTGAFNQPMSPASITNTGGSQPHNNMMPYLVLNFVIALQGIFPSQN
jgi:microcystin-dependent protein